MATEHLKCDSFEVTSAVSIKYIRFWRFQEKKKNLVNNFYIDYMMKW